MTNQREHAYRIASQILMATEHGINFNASLDNDDIDFEKHDGTEADPDDERLQREMSIFFAGYAAGLASAEQRHNSYTRGLVHAFSRMLPAEKRSGFGDLIESVYHSTVAKISDPLNQKRIAKI